MGRLKVQYAEPGTDPTRQPSEAPSVGLGAAIKDNWLLLVGICGLLIFAPRMLNRGKDPEIQASPTPTAEIIAVDASPIGDDPFGEWCEGPHGIFAPPGEYYIGSDYKVCRRGSWYVVNLGTAETTE